MILEDGLTYHNSKVTLTKKWQILIPGIYKCWSTQISRLVLLDLAGLVTNVTSTVYVWGAQVEQF